MRLDRLRSLLDHSQLLAADPPARRLLALAKTLSILRSAARVDCDVDCSRTAHATMATCRALHHALDVDSRHPSILDRPLDLLAIRKALQHRPTERPSRDSAQPSRTAVGYVRNPRPGSTSGLSRASLPDAGVDPGYWAGSLLCTNCVRDDHGHDHDSIGRRGTRATIWKRISSLSRKSTGSAAQSLGRKFATHPHRRKYLFGALSIMKRPVRLTSSTGEEA